MRPAPRSSPWDSPESVEKFARREPDHRLVELLDAEPDPAAIRVLDLGCAAGRNAVELARRGFDLHAFDGSLPMIERTRERLAEFLGTAEARRRAHHGRMDDLGIFADGHFDLIVALGVFHCASRRPEWDAALAESTRVLAPGGRLLVSVFTPETDLHGTGIHPIPGEPHVYGGFSSGRTFLVDAETLDAEAAARGLRSVVPSRTVRVPLEKGRRVVVNALYQKDGAS